MPKPWIPDSTDKNYVDSGLPYAYETRVQSNSIRDKVFNCLLFFLFFLLFRFFFSCFSVLFCVGFYN